MQSPISRQLKNRPVIYVTVALLICGLVLGFLFVPDILGREGLYLLQQSINALTVGAIYSLLAVGYTLVYSIVGRINLAFGDMATLGGYATLMGIALFTHQRLLFITTLILAVSIPIVYGAISGYLSDLLVFRHFHPQRGEVKTQAPLVAAIGLVIVVQEFLRITQGADNHWLPQMSGEPLLLAERDDFSVSITVLQLVIFAVVLLAFFMLKFLMGRTQYGRDHRACAQDSGMASLCGVNVSRTVMLSFVVGTMYAGLSGYVISIYYGVVNFYMGFSIGLKALTAAIVGGIGSVSGALLGSLLIGFMETMWSAYFSFEYRDVAVFGLLVTFLILKPDGILGRK